MAQIRKCDCGRKLSLREAQLAEVEILEKVASFCEQNHLRYYLQGGTLLGAVRHRGFIPWDDDVDINMPRIDCEKLYELTGGKLDRLMICPPYLANESGCKRTFYRVYCPDIIIEDSQAELTHSPTYYPLFLDIFPMDGMPSNLCSARFFYCRLWIIRKLLRVSEGIKASNLIKLLFHLIVFIPAKILGRERLCRLLHKTATKYPFDCSEYVGVMTNEGPSIKERVKRESWIKSQELEFEGRRYHVPGNYETYLHQVFGDYMKLPPAEKRTGHGLYFYQRKWSRD